MPERNFTDADIKALVDALKVSHQCSFSEEERQIIHDMVSGGRAFKKAVIYMVVVVALYTLFVKGLVLKAAGYFGWIK